MPAQGKESLLLSTEEFALLAGFHKDTVHKMVAESRLKCVKTSHLNLIPASELARVTNGRLQPM